MMGRLTLLAGASFLFALIGLTSAEADCYRCRCISTGGGLHSENYVGSESACAVGCGSLAPNTVPVSEERCTDCGEHWTGWRNLGSPGQNPCPRGCTQGQSVGDAYRNHITYTRDCVHIPLVSRRECGPERPNPPIPQERTKFKCFGMRQISGSAPPQMCARGGASCG
jgi:hypothetical protein